MAKDAVFEAMNSEPGTMGGPAFETSELHVATPQTEHITPKMTHPGEVSIRPSRVERDAEHMLEVEKDIMEHDVKPGETAFSHSFNATFQETVDEDENLEGPPRERFRPGGPKEARLNRVRLMETGRYYEAAIARNETPEDPDAFYSLRVDNLPLMTTENQLRDVFERFGQIGDVYRPIDKDTKTPLRFVFVRFIYKQHMLNALRDLQNHQVNGRGMKLMVAKPGRYELETSIY